MTTIATTGPRLAAIQRRLKKTNAAFRKLTKKQQRIAIAEDVLALLNAKKIRARSMYLDYSSVVDKAMTKAREAELDASCVLSQARCDVCGIGSLFVAAVLKNDRLPSSAVEDAGSDPRDIRDLQTKYLAQWFDGNQLTLIEHMFEYGTGALNDRYYSDGASPMRNQENATKRLRMICENIISNGGMFDEFRGAHATRTETT